MIESYCESISYRITAVSKMYCYHIKNEEYKKKKRKIATRYIKKKFYMDVFIVVAD